MRMRYSNPPDTRLRLTSDPPNRRRRRQSGNIMIMFTMMLPFVLIPMVGLAIDATMLYTVKLKLQGAVDGGALAATYALSAGQNDTAQEQAAFFAADQFIRANIQAGASTGSAGGYWGAYNFNDTQCTTDTNGNLVPTGSEISGGMTYANAVSSANCFVLTPPVNSDPAATAHLRTISVVASVNVPLLFMRILGFSSGKVSSRGSASRRDTVLEMVLDRSGSLTGEMTALKAGAENFVNEFSEGHDQLGLVLIDASSTIVYPTGDWNKYPPTTAGGVGTATGPDGNFKSTSLSPNMITQIQNFGYNGGNTGMTEGLMLAYYELLAANQPTALNAIVVWTDGQPNGFTADFNAGTSLSAAANSVKNSGSPSYNNQSGCTHTFDGTNGLYAGAAPGATSIIGSIAQWGGYAATGGGSTDTLGPFVRSQNTSGPATGIWANQTTVNGWLTIPSLGTGNGDNGGKESILTNASGAGNGCNYGNDLSTSNNNVSSAFDIPATDYYGNSTQGSSTSPYNQTDYRQSYIWTQPNANCQTGRSSVTITAVGPNGQDPTLPLQLTGNLSGTGLPASENACQIGLASWNTADMAAMQIHADATLHPRIYTMGYVGNVAGTGGVDVVLMSRLANLNGNRVNISLDSTTPNFVTINPVTGLKWNTVYNSTAPSGDYFQMQQDSDVSSAFNTLLGELLRLTR